jgi:hypothetical protein
VDCDVAPLSACHLLLGRPWQFDLDAIHGGRSNNYSFVHKGVHHVLKPMLDSAIKVEVFSNVRVKKKVAEITPKPRMALLQEGENDVNIPTLAAARESAIRCKEPIKSSIQFGSISNNIVGNNVAMMKGTFFATKVPKVNAQLNDPSEHGITIKGNSSVIINSLGEASDSHCKEWKNVDAVANKSPIQFGSLSNLVQHKDSI